MSLDAIPNDLKAYALGFFDDKSLGRICRTGWIWAELGKNEFSNRWKKRFQRYFPIEFQEILAREEDQEKDFSWRTRFLATHAVEFVFEFNIEGLETFYRAICEHDLSALTTTVSMVGGFGTEGFNFLLYGKNTFGMKSCELMAANGFQAGANALWLLAKVAFANEDKSILWIWGVQLHQPLTEFIHFFNKQDLTNQNIFLMALTYYHFELAEHMRRLGCDVNYVIPIRGQSLLWHVCSTRNLPAVKFLCEHGANVNLLTTSSRENNTPETVALEAACNAKSFACARYLLEQGSQVAILSLEAKTTLFDMLLKYPRFLIRTLRERIEILKAQNKLPTVMLDLSFFQSAELRAANCLLEIVENTPAETRFTLLKKYRESLEPDCFVARIADVFTQEVWVNLQALQNSNDHAQYERRI